MPDVSRLSITVELKDGQIVAQQITAIGDAGERTAQRVVQSSSAIEAAIARQADAARRYQESIERQAAAQIGASQRTQEEIAKEQAMQDNYQRIGRVAIARANQTADAQRMLSSEIRDGAKAYDTMTAAQEKATVSTVVATSAGSGMFTGFGRIRQGLTSLIASMTGTIPVLDRIGGQFLTMGLGGNVAIAVIAGIAAIALAYHYFTKDATEAKDAQDKLTESLKKWYEAQRDGEAGSRQKEVAAMQKQLSEDRAHLADELAKQASPTANRSEGTNSAIERDITETRRRIAEKVTIIAAGTVDVSSILKKSGEDGERYYNDQLTSLATSNKLQGNERSSALLQYRSYVEEGNKLSASQADNVRRVFVLGEADKLAKALFPIDKDAIRAARDAKREADALIAELLKSEDDYFNTQNKQKIAMLDVVAASRVARDEADRRLTAVRAGAEAEKALNDTLELEKVRRDFLNQSSLVDAPLREKRLASLLDEVRATQALNHSIDDTRDARRASDDAGKAADKERDRAARDAEREAARSLRQLDQEMRGLFSTFFTDLVTHGKSAFQSLFDAIRNGFIKLVSDIAAARITEKMGGTLGSLFSGKAGAAQSGGTGGLDSPAIPDSAIGLGTASSVNPYLVVGTAVAGLGLTMYSMGEQAKRAAEQVKVMTASLTATVEQMKADAGLANNARIAAYEASVEAARQSVRDKANAEKDIIGSNFFSTRWAKQTAFDNIDADTKKQIDEINRIAKIRLEQLEKEKAAAIELAALTLRRANEDVAVQIARNNGQTAQADAMAKQYDQERRFAELRKQGISEETIALLAESEVAKALADAAIKLRDAVRSLEDLNVRILNATGQGRAGSDRAFQNAQRREYEDAKNAGRSPEYLALLTETLVDEAIQRGIQQNIADQTKVITDNNARQQTYYDAQLKTAQDALKVNQQALQTAQQSAVELRRTSDILIAYGESLKVGSLSTLSPVQRLQEAKSQMEAVFALAKGGDAKAGAAFGQSANTFLGESRGYNASSAAYGSDFASVQAMTDQLKNQFGTQATVAEQQLAQLQKINATLNAEIQAINDAKAAANANAAAQIGALTSIPMKLDDAFLNWIDKHPGWGQGSDPLPPMRSVATTATSAALVAGVADAMKPMIERQDTVIAALQAGVEVNQVGLKAVINRLDALTETTSSGTTSMRRALEGLKL